MELFVKDVDKSLLKEGMSIPHKYQQELLDGLDIELEFGHKIDVDIIVENDKYDAVLKNQSYDKEKYKDHVPVMQIRYSPNSDLAKRLRAVFHKTQEYMETNNTTKIPDENKEYVKILLPGIENTIEFKPVKEYVETKAQDYKDDQVIKETKLQVDEELEKKKVQYENIDRMSKILLERIELIEDMESLLQDMDAQKDSFRDLNEYFNSAQRLNDIIDDENGDIPDNINKAALTQDELYNLLMDSRDTAVHMMENALEILKQK